MAAIQLNLVLVCLAMTSHRILARAEVPSIIGDVDEQIQFIPEADPPDNLAELFEDEIANGGQEDAGAEQTRRRRTLDAKNDIRVCYFCDVLCRSYIGNNDPTAYFDDLSMETSNRMTSLTGEPMTITNYRVLAPDYSVYLYWFINGDMSYTALETANFQFWYGFSQFMVTAKENGCEVGALVAYPDDYVFTLSSGKVAVASVLQMCTEFSFLTMRLNPTNITRMATILAHEIGHLLGAYHDGPVDMAFNSDWVATNLPTDLSYLYGNCSSNSRYCANDVSGLCLMSSYPISYTGSSETFSSCSRAYFNMWHALATISHQYDDTCLLEGNGVSKRDVEGARRTMERDAATVRRELMKRGNVSLSNDIPMVELVKKEMPGFQWVDGSLKPEM